MWSVKRWGEIEPRGSNLTTSPTGDRGEEEQVKVANVGRDHDGKVRGEVSTEPGSSTNKGHSRYWRRAEYRNKNE